MQLILEVTDKLFFLPVQFRHDDVLGLIGRCSGGEVDTIRHIAEKENET